MRVASLALCLLLFAPLLWLPAAWWVALPPDTLAAWQHTLRYVLSGYGMNTLLLALGAALVAGVAGVGCAWLVTCQRFPGRRFFTWGLMLPLAIPGYISAYAYGALTDAASPLAAYLILPGVRNLPGAALLLGLATFPYVYLLAKTAFSTQPLAWREVSQSMGYSNAEYFFRVALPAARPFWAMGITLAVMEAVADIGAVQILGVPTLASAVYRTWFSLGEPMVAARLAFMLMLLVLLVIALERMERAQARYASFSRAEKYAARLTGARGAGATLLCLLPLLLGFVIPVMYLAWLNFYRVDALVWGRVLGFLWDSLSIALVAGAGAVCIAVLLHFSERVHGGAQRFAHLLAYAGYAIPGVAVAVGMMLASRTLEDASGGALWLTGAFWGVCIACMIRFLATAMGSVHAGYARIPAELDMAAQSLGASSFALFFRVHLPLLTLPLLVALLVVMVDTMKELPATLILRPFDMKTLAIAAYEFASDDRPVDAAPYALLLIALTSGCMLAIYKLQRVMMKQHG